MGEIQTGGLAAVAWVVACALAIAAAAVAVAVSCFCRARRAELRMRQLESAVAEFYSALRARISVERARCPQPLDGAAPGIPKPKMDEMP